MYCIYVVTRLLQLLSIVERECRVLKAAFFGFWPIRGRVQMPPPWVGRDFLPTSHPLSLRSFFFPKEATSRNLRSSSSIALKIETCEMFGFFLAISCHCNVRGC